MRTDSNMKVSASQIESGANSSLTLRIEFTQMHHGKAHQ